MPFQRKRVWESEWEKAPDEGREFIASISAHDARERWSLILNKVQHNGVLVVRYHGRPIGVVGSPLILLEILRQRRAGKSEEWHREIEAGLEKAIRFAELQHKPKRAETPAMLSTSTISISPKPKSIAVLFREFDAVTVIYRQHQVRAFLLALPILARAWTDPVWTDRLLDWMREAIRTADEPLRTW